MLTRWKAVSALAAVACLAACKSKSGGGSNGGFFFPPDSTSVNALAIDPANPAHIIAGHEDLLEETTDGGQTWIQGAPNLSFNTIEAPRSIAFAGSSSTTVFGLAQPGPVTLGIPTLVAYTLTKSVDGGLTFTTAGVTPVSSITNAFACDPTNANHLVATFAPIAVTTASAPVIATTTDGGATWTQGSIPSSITSLGVPAIDAATPSAVFVSAAAVGSTCVLGSSDGGVTFQLTAPLPPSPFGAPTVSDIALTSSSVLVAGSFGLLKSTDGGVTWVSRTVVSAGNEQVSQLVVDPTTPTTVYAVWVDTTTLFAGVSRSTDTGETFTALPFSVPSAGARPLTFAVAPSSPSTLLIGTPNGLNRSTDGGRTWFPVAQVGWVAISTAPVAAANPTGGATP